MKRKTYSYALVISILSLISMSIGKSAKQLESNSKPNTCQHTHNLYRYLG